MECLYEKGKQEARQAAMRGKIDRLPESVTQECMEVSVFSGMAWREDNWPPDGLRVITLSA
ncbi:hypothetical protein [Dyella caseinilytica]|uniref:Uncharacterized protein n=1 Tax=Dyella caseinilytica TaxID=1849581 RepID=A0ABX7GWE2_9GAMM|nr:hypothetical protein [Dyella caseinilytica]QRN54802.1 hypothetical protein ISN74_05455 [Dyella caseinilytica]GFZ96963.1 hypothetical protein GCM10011408_16780 [Dyella caseinilytica]